ncbi:MAG: polyamine ABC transporter substrate-binding protein, partial [Cypionkella sp.]
KDAPGNEDQAYDFINAWLEHKSAKGLLEHFGYASANDAAMKEIPMEDLKAGNVDPVEGTLLAQVPIDPTFRDKMTQEFELIKSGF